MKIQDNYKTTLNTITKNGLLLEYASEKLKDNDKIVLTAIKQNGGALQYASNRLKDNYEIVLTAVTQIGYTLQYASDILKDNDNIVDYACILNKSLYIYMHRLDYKKYKVVKEKCYHLINVLLRK